MSKKIMFRTGDLVIETTSKEKGPGIVGHTKHWSIINGHIDVYFMTNGGDCLGAPELCDIKELKLFKKREDVKDYWKYIAK